MRSAVPAGVPGRDDIGPMPILAGVDCARVGAGGGREMAEDSAIFSAVEGGAAPIVIAGPAGTFAALPCGLAGLCEDADGTALNACAIRSLGVFAAGPA